MPLQFVKFLEKLLKPIMEGEEDWGKVQGDSKVQPLYFKARDVPKKLSVLEICREAEKITGAGEVDGAQCIRGDRKSVV